MSSITIEGKTNVNKFQCVINRYTGTDTLMLKVENGMRTVFTSGAVRLEASGFDCGLKAMTKDFAETISADEYPFIIIEFVSFERVPEYSSTEEKFRSKVKLTLASVSKSLDINCSVVRDEKGYIHLKGKHNLTFSDFNLDAPSKMMGLVKVDEKLKVNFHLVLKPQ